MMPCDPQAGHCSLTARAMRVSGVAKVDGLACPMRRKIWFALWKCLRILTGLPIRQLLDSRPMER
jgi:hypothetical protein